MVVRIKEDYLKQWGLDGVGDLFHFHSVISEKKSNLSKIKRNKIINLALFLINNYMVIILKEAIGFKNSKKERRKINYIPIRKIAKTILQKKIKLFIFSPVYLRNDYNNFEKWADLFMMNLFLQMIIL